MTILAAVDDLMFASKIRTTARQLGVDLVFARSPDEILAQTRALKPTLVIFDLNSQRTDPVATLGALKQDALLSQTRTLGFASHVHADLIAAARAAGADEVMPRSAFATHLAEILTEANRAPTRDED